MPDFIVLATVFFVLGGLAGTTEDPHNPLLRFRWYTQFGIGGLLGLVGLAILSYSKHKDKIHAFLD